RNPHGALPAGRKSAAQHAIEEDQRAEGKGDVAWRAAAAEQTGNEADRPDDENRQRPEPVIRDAARGQAEQNTDDVEDGGEGEVQEPLVGILVRGVVVTGCGGVFDSA